MGVRSKYLMFMGLLSFRASDLKRQIFLEGRASFLQDVRSTSGTSEACAAPIIGQPGALVKSIGVKANAVKRKWGGIEPHGIKNHIVGLNPHNASFYRNSYATLFKPDVSA